ncbi:peptidyl-prolyl cis-trans isomerase [Vermiphilus pyriformis]|nr:MAG: peptidyl-prolyl cis-trans isomerase [Vermiphilus pyriformis]
MRLYTLAVILLNLFNLPMLAQHSNQEAAVPGISRGSRKIKYVVKQLPQPDFSYLVAQQRPERIPVNIPESAIPVDFIDSIICGPEATDIITWSELGCRDLDGSIKNPEDIRAKRLIYQDAKRFKMVPERQSVLENLKGIQKEHNLTQAQLEQIFTSAGYTFEEGVEEFSRLKATQSAVGMRVGSRMSIPEKDIQAYYDAHPILQEANYVVKRVEFKYPAGRSRQAFRAQIDRARTNPERAAKFDWSIPFTVKPAELAQNRQFLTRMKNGQVSPPVAISDGVELFMMVEAHPERPVPLEQRREEITNILRPARFDQLMKEYKANLESAAVTIVCERPTKIADSLSATT